jgi:ABC-type multidrug transport system ATPase subunit
MEPTSADRQRNDNLAAAPLAIEMHGVELDFGNKAGVFDLNLTVPVGVILGLIGPSGCGKTTTVRLLTGLYRPQHGVIVVLGKSPSDFAPADRERIGYLPQHFALYSNLTVSENLHFAGSLYGLPHAQREARIKQLLDFTELSEARSRLVRHLSGGMQRRVMLAGALMHQPQMLFADEPTAGIDPVLRRRFWDYFQELRAEQRTLLITTQYVGEAAYCDYVAVMRRGRVLLLDTPDGLRRQALGGDAFTITIDPDRSWEVNEFLWRYPGVVNIERVAKQRDTLHLCLQDGQSLPTLLRDLDLALSLKPLKIEPYLPPFDDIFVRLMHRAQKEDADE